MENNKSLRDDRSRVNNIKDEIITRYITSIITPDISSEIFSPGFISEEEIKYLDEFIMSDACK